MHFANYADYKKNRPKLNFKPLERLCSDYRDKSSIAILIPYRNRKLHLRQFITHMNTLTVPSNSSVDVYIVEQGDTRGFNRGLMLNAGFLLASERKQYDRYISHDVDLYPNAETFAFYFSCFKHTIHYITPKPEHKYEFPNYFGGVLGMSELSTIRSNFYSNLMERWGSDDNVLANRLILSGKPNVYRPVNSSYELAHHDPPTKAELNHKRNQQVLDDFDTWRENGVEQLRGFPGLNVKQDRGFLATLPKNTNKLVKYFFYNVKGTFRPLPSHTSENTHTKRSLTRHNTTRKRSS